MSAKRVVIVEWLGRGGIAHTTQEWVTALEGHEVTVVTRPGRELAGVPIADVPSGRLRAHRAVARAAARVIDEVRPDLVVVQNYVVPVLERLVQEAAARAGSRVVFVVHNHQPHSRASGFGVGLRSALRRADTVVTHTRFVADAVEAWTGRSALTVPHPIPHAVVEAAGPPEPAMADAPRVALHFGVLKRGYKGTETVLDMAAARPAGWRFVLVGNGARATDPEIEVVSGYVDNRALARMVRASQATLLPYRRATQSGAVVVAQALGSVPIACAVGGIPEQIDHGATGLLVPPQASTRQWLDALAQLDDGARRRTLAEGARAHVLAAHNEFVTFVQEVVDGGR